MRNWLEGPIKTPEKEAARQAEIAAFIAVHGVDRYEYVPPEEDDEILLRREHKALLDDVYDLEEFVIPVSPAVMEELRARRTLED